MVSIAPLIWISSFHHPYVTLVFTFAGKRDFFTKILNKKKISEIVEVWPSMSIKQLGKLFHGNLSLSMIVFLWLYFKKEYLLGGGGGMLFWDCFLPTVSFCFSNSAILC